MSCHAMPSQANRPRRDKHSNSSRVELEKSAVASIKEPACTCAAGLALLATLGVVEQNTGMAPDPCSHMSLRVHMMVIRPGTAVLAEGFPHVYPHLSAKA